MQLLAISSIHTGLNPGMLGQRGQTVYFWNDGGHYVFVCGITK